MVKQEPLISILICNYNYEEFVGDALASALNQDYQNIEVIFVDDGSTDASVSVVERIIKERPQKIARLHVKTINEGICYARNDAINMAKGEYFVFLDSDDTIPADYVARLYKTAAAKHADVVYADVSYFGDQSGKSNEPEYDPERLLLDNYINISCLVNKSRIGSHRFDVKLNRVSHEDYDFWMGLSLKGLSFAKANNIHLNYRIQNQSRNNNTFDLTARTLTFVDRWEYMVKKYRQQFTLSDDLVFAQLRYQIKRVGTELSALSSAVQDELNPELEKREEYIRHQQQVLEDYKTHIAGLNRRLEEIVGASDYRALHWLHRRASKLKKIVRG